MLPTQTFRRQHDALLTLARDLSSKMQVINTRDDARGVVLVLSKMTGILVQHLAAEDELLYPRLIASNVPHLSSTAHRFAEEMGGLSAAYIEFTKKWALSQTILDDSEGFRSDAAGIIATLSKRIASENEVLYPMLDGIGGDSPSNQKPSLQQGNSTSQPPAG